MAKFCEHCGAQLDQNASYCIKCGKSVTPTNSPKKNKKHTALVIVFAICVISIFWAIIMGSDTQNEDKKNEHSPIDDVLETITSVETSKPVETIPSTPTPTPVPTPTPTPNVPKGLYLEDDHYGYADEYGIAYYIEGYVKNNSNKNYSYVAISFKVYDSEGNTIGSCYGNNSGLEANGRWKFKAICSGNANDVASYKFSEITKW